MAVTTKLKAGVTVVWGTTGVSNQAWGKLLSASRKRGSEKELIPDEEGQTVGVVYYDEKDTLQLEVLAKSGMTNPAIGDTITVDGMSGYVEDFELKFEHKGTKKLSVTATRFVSGGIP